MIVISDLKMKVNVADVDDKTFSKVDSVKSMTGNMRLLMM